MAEKRIKILIADDEADYCLLLKNRLEFAGNYEVIIESNGKNVLRAARRGPRVILLDIRMPGLNGLEVLRKLKKDPKTAAIPVLVISGIADEQTKIEAARLYSFGFLEKPVESEVLLAKIQKVLEQS